MAMAQKVLKDDQARRTAMTVHDRSYLVEAGAGSGKTAIMAGRIAMMMAEGVEPKTVAAVTFTELAASELFVRVREFVSELTAGKIPPELSVALPNGLTASHRHNLASASAAIDDMTCSTIHGFCQRLIKPYPVEADIDPGASIMDRNQAELAYLDLVDTWIREQLSVESDISLLTELVIHDPDKTVALVHVILRHLRGRRLLQVEVPPALTPLVQAFRQAADRFSKFIRKAAFVEPKSSVISEQFSGMADALAFASGTLGPAKLVRLLVVEPHPDLCTTTGEFRQFRKKGKWEAAAKGAGFSKADGGQLFELAETHYTSCRNTWVAMLQGVASCVLADLVTLLRPVLDRYRTYKRSTAILDFDDLIFAARNLLRDDPAVRHALAARFEHVLVDEYQDTDLLQTEIFWRLCGDPPADVIDAGWTSYKIRPGALFLVGDPKQAIYRFRGADVRAYMEARKALLSQAPDSVLSISTNFRSCASILHYVNDRFKGPLSVANQPGFAALDAFHPERNNGPCVAALDVKVADAEGNASAEQQRDGEADVVAEICARLIGSEFILDRRSGENRVCRPGDIALLAPTGTDLWRYEEALERNDIPVATQAGKGLFRRQEIQDLIAVTRVLADSRDTLALGALLRGPLVGLTEEELLDIVWNLPRASDAPDALPRLDLRVDPAVITHPLARDIIEKLQLLKRRANATTPFDLLSQSVDVLRLRPILLQRHRGQAQRALANVDLYLSLSRAYAVRGLRAFAETMIAAWSNQTRTVEGRPDAQEEAVVLITMHAAKGLEWPIVIPINTMTKIMATDSAMTDSSTGRFHCPVYDVRPTGYDKARQDETDEFERERVRLWYVAATRAREILILPKLDIKARSSTWNVVVELALDNLPTLDLAQHRRKITGASVSENLQSRKTFAAEAATIVAHHRKIHWQAPSRDGGTGAPVLRQLTPDVFLTDGDGQTPDVRAVDLIQGSRQRGLILHKLFEEVLTGEVEETMAALRGRAEGLIRELGQLAVNDPALGLSASELSTCVIRTLALPEISAIKPQLLPEFPLYSLIETETHDEASAGVVDAIAYSIDGAPEVVIDWKSDVAPTAETIGTYRAQVNAYLEMIEANLGLIVLATSGIIVRVTQKNPDPLTRQVDGA